MNRLLLLIDTVTLSNVITKFLLIDAALVLAIIPILLFVNSKNKRSSFFGNLSANKLLEKTSIKLPNKEKLLKLEKLAISEGSRIEFDSLVGDWQFISVWTKGNNNKDAIFSSLLRVFAARLELKKETSTEDPLKFSIINSIQFGLISIKFSGYGYLKGKQPLLPFFFNLIELKADSNMLFSRSLDEPEEKKKPFFALIAIEKNGAWLSARGQGGGLALWLKD